MQLSGLWFTSGMSEAAAELDRLVLKFDGQAVENHSIDVRDLAPSLLALADLYTVAHGLVGDGVSLPPALDVRDTGEGSFLVDLYLYFKQNADEPADLLTGRNVLATVTGLQLIEYVSHALRLTLMRFRNGPEQVVVQDAPEAGQIRVRWANGDELECPPEARDLAASMDFNRTAGRVFEPVRKPGIDSMDLGREDEVDQGRALRVRSRELGAFNVIEGDDEVLSDNPRRVIVTVENLAFRPGNKWRVHDGTSPFWATVTDREFLMRFAAGEEAFAAGDSLLVDIRDVQLRSPARVVRGEHFIERVIEHRRRQDDDPFPEPAG